MIVLWPSGLIEVIWVTGPLAGAAIFTWLRDEVARRTEFWRWYLLDAIPTARYDAECQTLIEQASGEDEHATL